MKLIFIISILLISPLAAQIGFQSRLSIDPGEPNTGQILEVYNSGYLIGGEYFDLDLGRWETSFSYFDYKGEFQWQKNLTVDTTGQGRIPMGFIIDSTGFSFPQDFGVNNRIVRYDSKGDSIHVSTNFKYWDYNFITRKAMNKYKNDTIFVSGRNFDELTAGIKTDVMMLRITPSDTIVVRTQNNSVNSQIIGDMDFTLESNIAVACYDRKLLDVGVEFSTYVNMYDSNLNLLFSGYEDNETCNILGNDGIEVDKNGDIVVIGSDVEFFNNGFWFEYPSLCKFNSDGKFLWQRRLGNNVENRRKFGGWRAVIESQEKDGYILVGSEIDETEFQDSLLGRAAIAKVSYEGDSIWMRTYSFRTPRESTNEEFNDVILTEDGHYVVAGNSFQRGNYPEEGPQAQALLVKMNDEGIYDPSGTSTIELNAKVEDVIQIGPNPAHSYISIRQSSDILLRGTISNMNGQVVDTFISEGKDHIHLIDVSSYKSGQYIIHAHDKRDSIFVRKFIVLNN